MLAYPQARNALFKKHALAISLSFLFYPAAWAAPSSNALPVLGNIASGTADVTRNISQGKLTVNQQTDKLIVNWNSFNVGANAHVVFNQPSTNSIALNRIGSAAASQIFGQVTANGKLILVNPNGLTIGSTGQISANSVIASILNISDGDFNTNNLTFERGTATGTVDNQGAIQSTNGTALLAPTIKNSGSLSASNGNVNLANGNRLTSNGITISLSQASSIPSLIQNTGTLQAERISGSNGRVYILGDRYRTGSTVELSGMVNAISSNIKGKQINVTGQLDSTNSLALDAVDSINVNGIVNISNPNQLLSLTHGTKAGDGYYLNDTAKINLAGSGIGFKVNSDSYTVIRNVNELQAINASTASLAGKYVLGNTIDATDTRDWNLSTITSSEGGTNTFKQGFKPIGGATAITDNSTPLYFSGKFDGLGHSIERLTINRPNQNYIGLFGASKNADIRNLSINNLNLTGNRYVGGLTGYNLVTTSSQIDGNTLTGVLSTTSDYFTDYKSLGGIIGYNNVTGGTSDIFNNHVNANLTSYGTTVGGIIGVNNVDLQGVATIHDNSYSGTLRANSIAAGLIAKNINQNGSSTIIKQNNIYGLIKSNGYLGENLPGMFAGLIASNQTGDGTSKSITSIENNLVSGNVEASNMKVGGLIASNHANTNSTLNIKGNLIKGHIISRADYGDNDSYPEIYDGDAVGGFIGYNNSAGIINFDNNQITGNVVAVGDFIGGLIGYNYVPGGLNINNNHITGKVVGGSYLGGLMGYSTTRVGGSLNIGNNTVANTISGKEYTGGLIGQLILQSSTANIKSSNVSGTVKGYDYTGGLIGKSDIDVGVSLTISNSNTSNSITGRLYSGGLLGQLNLTGAIATIKSSHSSGNITGSSYTGGLVGQVTLSNTGAIILPQLNISNSNTTGNINGASFVGGLFGSSRATAGKGNLLIGNTYASGNVTAIGARAGGLIGEHFSYNTPLRIFNSYANGAIAGSRSTGGLIGYTYNPVTVQVDRSFWDLDSTGQPASIGGTGLSSEQMKQLSTYAGWSINSNPAGSSIWYIHNGFTPPTLR